MSKRRYTTYLPGAPPASKACWALPATPEGARRGRRLLGECLNRWRVGPHTVADAEIIAAEYLANAALHSGSRTPHGMVLSVHTGHRDAGPYLRVEVADRGTWKPPAPRLEPDHRAESGRGVAMVAHLASDYGLLHQPAEGTRAWAELPL
ncbi:ATP-binding protein [Yinghuangia seranimata]|uniref:ATP-binding protein n=1 Tax=Yinghuangia seranimata TaxID=408067 RepID=UPI00248A96F8|nr:ATP-binding protein [Yinghuangia seranimata]MDI2131665.1 ATP-binding protein [Yinghuangia seranimata]